MYNSSFCFGWSFTFSVFSKSVWSSLYFDLFDPFQTCDKILTFLTDFCDHTETLEEFETASQLIVNSTIFLNCFSISLKELEICFTLLKILSLLFKDLYNFLYKSENFFLSIHIRKSLKFKILFNLFSKSFFSGFIVSVLFNGLGICTCLLSSKVFSNHII